MTRNSEPQPQKKLLHKSCEHFFMQQPLPVPLLFYCFSFSVRSFWVFRVDLRLFCRFYD